MRDGYDYSSPLTVYGSKTADQAGGTQGGPFGIVLESPFGSEACEYALQLVVIEAAGKVSISAEGLPPAVGATGPGGVRGYIFNATAAEVIALHPVFTPLTNGKLYISLNISGGNASATFVFRRHKGHVPEFEPMMHSANPEDEYRINQARERAVVSSEPSTPRRK